jgi:hypothetical protein
MSDVSTCERALFSVQWDVKIEKGEGKHCTSLGKVELQIDNSLPGNTAPIDQTLTRRMT